MHADGSLDLDGAQRLVAHLLDTGHDGVVVNGTTGESATTTRRREDQLVRAVWRRSATAAAVVAGVGHQRHGAHRRARAQRAEQAGAHGLLLVTPVLQQADRRPASLAHFRAVADATDLPVMLYDIPEPHRRPDRHRDAAAARRAPADRRRQGRQGRPVVGRARSWPRPTCCASPATTWPTCRSSRIGATGCVSVVGARRRPEYARDDRRRRRRRPRRGAVRPTAG